MFHLFHLSLRSANHVRHYSIVPTDRAGWEVTLEEDRMLRRRDLYQDWHRVERALALFEREVSELTEQGWRVAPDEARPGGSSAGLSGPRPEDASR